MLQPSSSSSSRYRQRADAPNTPNASVPMLQCLRVQRRQPALEGVNRAGLRHIGGELVPGGNGVVYCGIFQPVRASLFSLNLCRCEARILPSAGVIQRSSVVMATSPRWWSYRGVPGVAVGAVLRGFVVLGLSSAGWCCIPHAVLGRIYIGWLGSGPFQSPFSVCPEWGSHMVAPYSRPDLMRLRYAVLFRADGLPLRFRLRKPSFLFALLTVSRMWSEKSRERLMMTPRYVATLTCWRILLSIS